jgi:hypothetical protein
VLTLTPNLFSYSASEFLGCHFYFSYVICRLVKPSGRLANSMLCLLLAAVCI